MPDKQPNILWICTDQHRFDALSCYGNSIIKTPNIDSLAQSGIRFEQAFCQNPVCTPSRSSFLTGRYPRTTRNRQNGQSIPEDEVLVSKLFHDAGYACGLSGKLHLSACNPKASPTTERRIDDGYDIFNWSHSAQPMWPTNQYIHWLTEQGVTYRNVKHPECKHVAIGMPEEHHQTKWAVDRAINFVQSCGAHPWFFSLNIFDPHSPFNPPENYLNRQLSHLDELPLPNYVEGELENKPYFQKQEYEFALNSTRPPVHDGYITAQMTDKDQRYIKAAYYAMIEFIDDQIGQLLKALDASGQRENTLVIFMSDHGELLGDHGMYYKGPFFYDPCVRVPLILSWPGVIPAGRSSGALVELVDLAPTLLEAAGLEHYPGMQGQSIWGLLTGEADINRHRDDIYCEYYNSLPWNKPGAHATMVRSDQYKLVAYHGVNPGELYDLHQDPNETVNRWDDPEYVNIKLEMLERLCNRMAWTVDPLPLRNGPW
jgi:arylsulfatase